MAAEWVFPESEGYKAELGMGSHPAVTLRSASGSADLTIATYGGMAGNLAEVVRDFIAESGIYPEIVVLSQLSPLDFLPIVESVSRTASLVFVEEGGLPFGVGAEVIASVVESGVRLKWARRIGAAPVPIPSPPVLETRCLPLRDSLLEGLLRLV